MVWGIVVIFPAESGVEPRQIFFFSVKTENASEIDASLSGSAFYRFILILFLDIIWWVQSYVMFMVII